jgi:Zn ribbon nucleic-acid-binding protein
MSDTIQTVRWSLGTDSHLSGQFSLPDWREPIDDVLWKSIRRLGLEERIRAAFQMTAPLWYGLWIGNPLTAAQCSLLRDVFMEAARIVPSYREHTEEFIRALAESAETGEPLQVELTPPGHVDLGWVTTFVHCPRCKAEGPVERWQQTYSEELLECPVCGYSYQPAATHSSERDLFAETVRCPACQTAHRVKDFPDGVIQVLEDHHNFAAFKEELIWLERIKDFYERHPGVEGKIKPHVLEVLESRDPKVLEAMFAGAPFDEVELPSSMTARIVASQDWSTSDREVIEYLRHHHFSLADRVKFVQESIERLGLQLFQASTVRCSKCGESLA